MTYVRIAFTRGSTRLNEVIAIKFSRESVVNRVTFDFIILRMDLK